MEPDEPSSKFKPEEAQLFVPHFPKKEDGNQMYPPRRTPKWLRKWQDKFLLLL